MRLDHLLSTEFCGRTVVRRCGDASLSRLPGRVASLAGWEKVKAPASLWCGWTVVWCMLLGSRTARPLVGGGVPFPPSWPCPLCGVGAWGGVVWWFENWRVDASMNGVPCGVCRVCSYC